MEEKEIWKDIAGYENLYQVSNIGRVKSLDRNVKSKCGTIRTIRGCIIKPRKNRYGYLQLFLNKEGKKKTVTVHRLVSEAFLPNPLNLQQINHKNECKEDNRVENLEFCDAKYNINYGNRNKKASKTQINDKKKSKAVRCIETGIIYPSIKEVERQLGFSQQNISACCRGKLKSSYKLHWKYAD